MYESSYDSSSYDTSASADFSGVYDCSYSSYDSQHCPHGMLMEEDSSLGMWDGATIVDDFSRTEIDAHATWIPCDDGWVAVPKSRLLALDVECVATGPKHTQRALAQIGAVDWEENELLNVYIKPKESVHSYLTPLTGITEEKLEEEGVSPEVARRKLEPLLGPEVILVGVNVQQDAAWLELEQGEHYASLLCLAELFSKSFEQGKRQRYYGLDHLCQCWLGIPKRASHDAAQDAMLSMSLYKTYIDLMLTNIEMFMDCALATITTAVKPSFAKLFPLWENCCMGNKRACVCGAPFEVY